MLKLANSGNIKYPDPGKGEDMNLPLSKGDTLEFDPYDYEFNGSMTATVILDGIPVSSENDKLYAYAGNEIRGIAVGQFFPPVNKWLYTLMVYSNAGDGEIINFGFYDSVNDKYLKCEETITFKNEMVLADAYDPFELHISSGSVGIEEPGIDEQSFLTYPNPFESNLNIEYNLKEPGQVRLSVFDVYGRLIKDLVDQRQEPGNYHIEWTPDLPLSGTYFIKHQVGNRQVFRKVIYMK